MRKPVLAVIAGGGCRQIEAATGMLQALDARGVRIDRYFGSSAGAVAAALHASGMTGHEMEQLIRNTPARQLFAPCWRCQLKSLVPGMTVDHLYDAGGMFRILQNAMAGPALDRVRSRVRVAVTRRHDYASLMCDATPATVMASAAIPEVFPPVEINGELYVDGGVKNIVPLPKLSEFADYRHIYILLCNDDAPGRKPLTRIGRAIEAFYSTMDREYTQLYELGIGELPSVTILQPAPYPSNLLGWSKDYGLIEHAFEHAYNTLAEEENP